MRRILWLTIGLCLIAAACAEQGASAVERQLPPLPLIPTTTTTATVSSPPEVDERAADQEAQAELESGLEAARDVYRSRGTFDASIGEMNALGMDRFFVGLEDAAFANGVVYDPHDQRVTLYRQSASGTWFCIDDDVRGAETDFGLGDSFETALRDCSDGVTSVGWKNTFAANGLDESAIESLLLQLSHYLDQGDVAGAHSTFHPRRACSLAELVVRWPEGRGLGPQSQLELLDVQVDGDTASATINLGDASGLDWQLERYGDRWFHSAEACEVLVPLATASQNAYARGLLMDGLGAVRNGFVDRSAFEFPLSALADLEPTIAFVAPADLEWGVVGYQGRETYGLVLTEGSPGRYFCAVESLGAPTGYGIGEALESVDSQSECSQSSEGLPDFSTETQ